MINHIRTLLLDEDGNKKPDWSYPLEEFVPTDFKAQKFPFVLRKVWNAIFGVKPDRAYKNWRLFQLSELAQASSLVEYWTSLDSRITHFDKPNKNYSEEYGKATFYLNKNGTTKSLVVEYANNLVSPVPGTSLVNQTTRPEELDLFISGKLLSDDISGKCYSIFKMDLNASDVLEIRSLTDKTLNQSHVLTFSSGLSQVITLPGLDLRLSFKDNGPASWNIDVVSKPTRDLGTIVANLDSLPNSDVLQLFSGNSSAVKTFKNHWLEDDNLVERLSAIVLALAYKIHEARDA